MAARKLTLTRDALTRTSGRPRPGPASFDNFLYCAAREAAGSGGRGPASGRQESGCDKERCARGAGGRVSPRGVEPRGPPRLLPPSGERSGELGLWAPLPPDFRGRCHQIPYTPARVNMGNWGRRERARSHNKGPAFQTLWIQTPDPRFFCLP